MLLSMTGYGEARHQSDTLTVAVEVRALNNRYLKVSLRASEPYTLLEPEFEKVIRRTVRRGTIQVHLDCRRQQSPQDFQINAAALGSYLVQLRRLAEDLKLRDRGESLLAQVLALPGVVPEPGAGTFNLEDDWPVFERVLEEALGRVQIMRQEEGRAMAQELLQCRDHIGQHLERIRQQVPAVSEGFPRSTARTCPGFAERTGCAD